MFEDKSNEEIEDPSFYQKVEENIYDDSSVFIPSNDYQKKCSIKKENEGKLKGNTGFHVWVGRVLTVHNTVGA